MHGVMARVSLHHHCPCNSSQGWTLDVSVNPLPKCSSSRAAASTFLLPKGCGTYGHGRCLTMKHGNAACGVKLDATLTVDSQSVFGYEATLIAAEAIIRAKAAKEAAVAEAVIRARAAKEAAIALTQARADEVASTVALARATAQSAEDLTRVTHANFWHGNLPSDTYGLLLERARHIEIEHHKVFDVLERMIMDDERQGMHNKTSALSLDFVHAMQGSSFHEDVVSITPSEGEILIAAKSLRRDERVAKRMRASRKATKAAAMAALALTALPSVQGNSKKTSDCVKPFPVTNSRKGHKLLTATEEVQLSHKVQDLLGLEAIRSSLQEQLGREPALTEWAGAVDMTVGSLSSRLHEGRQAKNRMVQSNLGLVALVANKYQGKGMSFKDLVQAGKIGLIRSCEKFDSDKGCKFSTYAHYWIMQRITRMIHEKTHFVRVPTHLSEARAHIRQVKIMLFHKYQRPPREKDLAKILGTTVERLRAISKSFKTYRSLDKPVGKDKNMNLGEYIADETLEHPESIIDRQFFKQDLNKLLEILSKREMDVVRERFGLHGGKAMTLRGMGSKYNVTGERIRQIETIAMQKLQQSHRNKVLKEYIRDYG